MNIIDCYTSGLGERGKLQQLIRKTDIQCRFHSQEPESGFYLQYMNDCLTLSEASSSLGISVDFTASAIQQRIKKTAKKPDLVKAVEGKQKKALYILDMTAGLGVDAFTLAAHGHRITAIEQNAYLYTILHASLEKAQSRDPETANIARKITLYFGNSNHYRSAKNDRFDRIYLDPMFPERRKSAKVKKNMQLLHKLTIEEVGTENLLFNTAKKISAKKIIVKRPRISEFLNHQIPTHQLVGKSCRFDIYTL